MDNKTLNLVTTVLRITIAVLGVLFIFLTISGTGYTETGKAFLDDTGDIGLSSGLMLTYIAIGLCVIAWLLFGVGDLVLHFADRKKVLLGFVVFIVMLLIGYGISSDHVFLAWADKGVTASTSKWVGAGLMSFYILVSCAIGTIIWSEIRRLIS